MICLCLDYSLSNIPLHHPPYNGEKPEFTAWTRDARYNERGRFPICFCVGSVIPVGALYTENSVLVGRGTTVKVYTYVHWR